MSTVVENLEQLKEEYKDNPPRYVFISIPHPPASTLKEIRDFTWKEYHVDIDTCPESNEYMDLFYNWDLRSHMGHVEEHTQQSITLMVDTESYRSGGGCWQEYWEKMLKNATYVKKVGF